MERKEQEQYAILLAKKLKSMLDKNAIQKETYRAICLKRQKDANSLTVPEREIYWSGGIVYSKSAIKRVRIELNKTLIELEKEYD